MLYDEHRKLGFEHARMGTKRHKWSDPHLQAAYDEGYNLHNELEGAVDDYMAARQSIPGLPGNAAAKVIIVQCANCNRVWKQSSALRARCANCGYINVT